MRPTHCAFSNCESELLNAWGGSFCAIHEKTYGSKCRVIGCHNEKVQPTQACQQHKSQWDQHVHNQSPGALAGVWQILRHSGDNSDWLPSLEQNTLPHDGPVPPEREKKHYFSPIKNDLSRLHNALTQFHMYCQIFITVGVQSNFLLPQQHSIIHYSLLIRVRILKTSKLHFAIGSDLIESKALHYLYLDLPIPRFSADLRISSISSVNFILTTLYPSDHMIIGCRHPGCLTAE